MYAGSRLNVASCYTLYIFHIRKQKALGIGKNRQQILEKEKGKDHSIALYSDGPYLGNGKWQRPLAKKTYWERLRQVRQNPNTVMMNAQYEWIRSIMYTDYAWENYYSQITSKMIWKEYF